MNERPPGRELPGRARTTTTHGTFVRHEPHQAPGRPRPDTREIRLYVSGEG